eukprot:5987188-Pyramimonas_sp.AAC.1
MDALYRALRVRVDGWVESLGNTRRAVDSVSHDVCKHYCSYQTATYTGRHNLTNLSAIGLVANGPLRGAVVALYTLAPTCAQAQQQWFTNEYSNIYIFLYPVCYFLFYFIVVDEPTHRLASTRSHSWNSRLAARQRHKSHNVKCYTL